MKMCDTPNTTQDFQLCNGIAGTTMSRSICKETLLITLILTYSTANQALLLETDVSKADLGAVLSQTEIDGKNNQLHMPVGDFPSSYGLPVLLCGGLIDAAFSCSCLPFRQLS